MRKRKKYLILYKLRNYYSSGYRHELLFIGEWRASWHAPKPIRSGVSHDFSHWCVTFLSDKFLGMLQCVFMEDEKICLWRVSRFQLFGIIGHSKNKILTPLWSLKTRSDLQWFSPLFALNNHEDQACEKASLAIPSKILRKQNFWEKLTVAITTGWALSADFENKVTDSFS